MPFENRDRERQRLIAIMGDYLEAMVSRDFRTIKFAPNLKNTDNGVELALGTGMTRTIRALRDGGQYFVDVTSGQVEFWGVVEEGSGDTIYGVRLRVEGTLISEVETLGVRNTDPYYFPEVILSADGGFHDLVPADKRASRADLIEIANRYFDAIEQNDGSLVPVRGDCQRLVNGAEDTVADVSDLGESEAHRALTVQAQITEGHYGYIEALRERRFPIVDEARGLVLAHVLFDHPGDLPKPNGDVPFGEPNTMIGFEVFKVAGGEVQAVWAICYSVPYGSSGGWGAGETRHALSLA